jgi:hypothetical protein
VQQNLHSSIPNIFQYFGTRRNSLTYVVAEFTEFQIKKKLLALLSASSFSTHNAALSKRYGRTLRSPIQVYSFAFPHERARKPLKSLNKFWCGWILLEFIDALNFLLSQTVLTGTWWGPTNLSVRILTKACLIILVKGKVISVHAMKLYGVVELQLYLFLTLALAGVCFTIWPL